MAESIDTREIVPEIVLDDGSVRIPIKNGLGVEIGVFCFRPTDFGIISRYNKMIEHFDEVLEPLQQVGGSDEDMTDEKAYEEAKIRLFKACDELFNGNFSEAFFGSVDPFSPINGKFYCETAIEAVGNVISSYFDEEVKKINARLSKYTHGRAARTSKHSGSKK